MLKRNHQYAPITTKNQIYEKDSNLTTSYLNLTN